MVGREGGKGVRSKEGKEDMEGTKQRSVGKREKNNERKLTIPL